MLLLISTNIFHFLYILMIFIDFTMKSPKGADRLFFHVRREDICSAGGQSLKKPPHRATAGGSFLFSSILKRRVDSLLALAPVGAELVHEALEMRVVVALPEMRKLVDDDVF